MTLRHRMGWEIAALIICLLMISAASLWGMKGLQQDFSSAIGGYRELRELYDASSHLTTARTLIRLSPHAENFATGEVRQALRKFDQYAASTAGDLGVWQQRRQQFGQKMHRRLVSALAELKPAGDDRRAYDPAAQTAPLSAALNDVADLALEIRKTIERKQDNANRQWRMTLLVGGVVSVVLVLGLLLISAWHYRTVMRPLSSLGHGVRQLAEGNLSQRIKPSGLAEFAALAGDFNRMAEELDGLYRQLERKVAEKSKELVRSERLASVGFLAAGVAHEINNPIGIIAGYAEFTLGQLRKGDGPLNQADVEKALTVIAEEAFRCKQIVQKLLTLARPGEESRTLIDLGKVASDVVSLVGGLKEYHDRRLSLEIEPGPCLSLLASEGEMKQVILNLTLNALEALESGGQVLMSVHRREDELELSVRDNGRGMSPEVLDRVFEPFFTAKRGSSKPGTGLGLSITHAIIQSHGGRITAQSDGLGKGSCFVVRLPAEKNQ